LKSTKDERDGSVRVRDSGFYHGSYKEVSIHPLPKERERKRLKGVEELEDVIFHLWE